MLLKVILILYAAMSLITFTAYGLDKRRAGRGAWRIPERTLHLLELACGWPGALAGQAVFKHKRRKGSFMLVFAGIVLIHGVALGLAWHCGLFR